ncbi:MAG: hypothetical protein HZB43_03965 [candidate division Zixibacteria bacterium]|nr:hypothetical protein [candidate division Zixibacteria bacterium]
MLRIRTGQDSACPQAIEKVTLSRAGRPLLFRLVVVILAAVSLSRICMAAAEDDKIKRLGGGRYLVSSVQVLDATGISTLRVEGPGNLAGHVVVTADARDSVRIETNRIVRVQSEEMASRFLEEIKVNTRLNESGVLSLEIITPRAAPWEGSEWSVTLDLTITIPPRWDFESDAKFFEYDLRGPFRDVIIMTQHGRAKLQNVSRRVEIHGEYTSIELADIKGAVDVSTTYAKVDVRRVVCDPDRSVQVENSYGPISVSELVGSVVAQTEYAPIRLDRVSLIGQPTRISGENVTVDADIAEFGSAKLDIHTSRSPVKIQVPTSLSARLNLSVGSGGTIRTRGLTIQTHEDLLGNGRLEGICGKGAGVIDIDVSGSSVIELRGK